MKHRSPGMSSSAVGRSRGNTYVHVFDLGGSASFAGLFIRKIYLAASVRILYRYTLLVVHAMLLLYVEQIHRSLHTNDSHRSLRDAAPLVFRYFYNLADIHAIHYSGTSPFALLKLAQMR